MPGRSHVRFRIVILGLDFMRSNAVVEAVNARAMTMGLAEDSGAVNWPI